MRARSLFSFISLVFFLTASPRDSRPANGRSLRAVGPGHRRDRHSTRRSETRNVVGRRAPWPRGPRPSSAWTGMDYHLRLRVRARRAHARVSTLSRPRVAQLDVPAVERQSQDSKNSHSSRRDRGVLPGSLCIRRAAQPRSTLRPRDCGAKNFPYASHHGSGDLRASRRLCTSAATATRSMGFDWTSARYVREDRGASLSSVLHYAAGIPSTGAIRSSAWSPIERRVRPCDGREIGTCAMRPAFPTPRPVRTGPGYITTGFSSQPCSLGAGRDGRRHSDAIRGR